MIGIFVYDIIYVTSVNEGDQMSYLYDFIVDFLFNEFEERYINGLPSKWLRVAARVLLGLVYILILVAIVWLGVKVFKIL